MAILVRPCAEGDTAAVTGLADRLAVGVAEWRDPEAVLHAVRTWVAESAAPGFEGAAFVAEDGGEVVGFASVSTVEHFAGEVDAYVGELVVAAPVEGAGVGGRLLEAAEAWARERGFRCLTLTTGAANARARAFYAARGFRDEDVKLTKVLR
ncbi:MAG: GNAT family N-acetyltransferase [Nocardioides sp.]